MKQSITQTSQNDKQISTAVRSFFQRYHAASALKSANARRQKGIPAVRVFQYLFTLAFTNRSMYLGMQEEKYAPGFGKDTVYRFLNSIHINWCRFTTILSSRIIKNTLLELTSAERVNVLIVDDSPFLRNRSKAVELLVKNYDHALKRYYYGFRMLSLGWSDGSTFLPVNSILLSSENQEKHICRARKLDQRTNGYKRRQLSIQKATDAMLTLLKSAIQEGIPASHVLFDSWFAFPSTLHAVKELGFHVTAMVKKTPKMHFLYEGEAMSLPGIYKKNKKRRGRSKYLLSVCVQVYRDGKVIPARVVFVRNKNKRSDYLCLISTDVSLTEEEIICLYGRRWDIEVFFKVCKSYLRLSRECRSLSYDAVTAHTAVVFTRYMMLALESRQAGDPRTLGELFYLCCDEMADITWLEAFHLLQQLLMQMVQDAEVLTEEMLQQMMTAFLAVVPSYAASRLCFLQ